MQTTSEPEPIALSQLAYSRIRNMLRDGKISTGMKISEGKLAKELGFSRTPVRDAIRRLQNEGLVYQVPQSGTYVSRPGRREIAEIYDVRLALECRAIERTAMRISHEHLDQLSQFYQTMFRYVAEFRDSKQTILTGEPLSGFLKADLEFHLVIFEAADNHIATKIYNDVQMRNRAFGDQSHHRDLRHLTSVLTAHANILTALQNQDAVEARKFMASHIEDSLRDALTTFDQIPRNI
ncbi:GntR family transcriptional regulator [Lacunimicrobium album]